MPPGRGVLDLDAAAVEAANRVDPMITIATRLHPVRLANATLIQTETGAAGTGKGEAAIAARLEALGMQLSETRTVTREIGALGRAVAEAAGDIILILAASATSDPADVAPEALRRAGGAVTRFDLPVDPGNLFFLGHLRTRPMIGPPGCARSPALKGADWVLERVVCGLPVTGADMAAMGGAVF